jgi:hypothetical protein
MAMHPDLKKAVKYCEKHGWSEPIVVGGEIYAIPPHSDIDEIVPVGKRPRRSSFFRGLGKVLSVFFQIIGSVLLVFSAFLLFFASR